MKRGYSAGDYGHDMWAVLGEVDEIIRRAGIPVKIDYPIVDITVKLRAARWVI